MAERNGILQRWEQGSRQNNMSLDIVELAARVKRAAIGRPRAFVGIDGPGASGKSTLAEKLVAAMGERSTEPERGLCNRNSYSY